MVRAARACPVTARRHVLGEPHHPTRQDRTGSHHAAWFYLVAPGRKKKSYVSHCLLVVGRRRPPSKPSSSAASTTTTNSTGGVRGAPSSDCAHGAHHGKNDMHAVPCRANAHTVRLGCTPGHGCMQAAPRSAAGGSLAPTDDARCRQVKADGRRQLPESQVTQHSSPRPGPFRPAKQAAGRPITRAGRLACMQRRTTSQISQARQLTFSPRGRRQLREVASCPSVVVAPHGPICLRMDPCASYLAGRAGGLSQTGDGGDVRASVPASQRVRYLPTAAGAPIC